MMTQKFLKHYDNIILSKGVNNALLGWYGTYTIEIAFSVSRAAKKQTLLDQLQLPFPQLDQPPRVMHLQAVRE